MNKSSSFVFFSSSSLMTFTFFFVTVGNKQASYENLTALVQIISHPFSLPLYFLHFTIQLSVSLSLSSIAYFVRTEQKGQMTSNLLLLVLVHLLLLTYYILNATQHDGEM